MVEAFMILNQVFFVKYNSKDVCMFRFQKQKYIFSNSTDSNIVLKIEEVVRIIGNKQTIDSKYGF
ncbi:MAG: hypothetical protein RLZZ74_244 [Cyanobacteriota bacterium]|jgi:hypothetical protein